MIDDLISRLRRQDLFDLHGSVALVNPDGPEAAEALILLRDALSFKLSCEARSRGDSLEEAELKAKKCIEALTSKIEKAE